LPLIPVTVTVWYLDKFSCAEKRAPRSVHSTKIVWERKKIKKKSCLKGNNEVYSIYFIPKKVKYYIQALGG